HREAYSWRTKTTKQIRPMSQESKTITTWRNGAGACWRNQYSREFVATYDEEQPRQHGIRRSMSPMAPFPQSVFRYQRPKLDQTGGPDRPDVSSCQPDTR